MVVHLDRGDMISQRDLVLRFSALQYTRNDLDFRRATFRVRGDTVDVYPADSDKEALRIEFFGDEIEKLSWIDPLTGEVLSEVPRVTIFPKTHYVTPKETVTNCIPEIKEELKVRLNFLGEIALTGEIL